MVAYTQVCAPGLYSFQYQAADKANNVAKRILFVRVVERAVTTISVTLDTAYTELADAAAVRNNIFSPRRAFNCDV